MVIWRDGSRATGNASIIRIREGVADYPPSDEPIPEIAI
jgi:hypothetical protein